VEHGIPAKNNAELVEMMAWFSRKMGREIAAPGEARKILGLVK